MLRAPLLRDEEYQDPQSKHSQVIVHNKSVESEAWLGKMKRVQRRKGVQDAIKKRDEIADSFIEKKNNDPYYRVVSNPSTKSSTKLYAVNLMEDSKSEVKNLVEELRESADSYFDYDTDQFKFYERKDKSLRNLLEAPLVHADMEEENIEERFPREMRSRALLVALGKIIRRNQWLHVIKKRKIQIYFTTLPVVVGVAWPSMAAVFSFLVSYALDGSFVSTDSVVLVLSLVIFLFLSFIYLIASTKAIHALLNMITIIFDSANETSFSHVRVGLASFAASIYASFPKFFSDIEANQNISAEFRKEEWPDKAQKIFEIAIWQGKRLEYVERFAQIQYERLRIFELFSDEVGNMSSRIISLAAAATTLIALIIIYKWDDWLKITEMVAIASSVAVIAWLLGKITRGSAYSFSIRDILKQGEVEEGNSFIDLDYYKSISNQFKSTKAAQQSEFLRTNRY